MCYYRQCGIYMKFRPWSQEQMFWLMLSYILISTVISIIGCVMSTSILKRKTVMVFRMIIITALFGMNIFSSLPILVLFLS